MLVIKESAAAAIWLKRRTSPFSLVFFTGVLFFGASFSFLDLGVILGSLVAGEID
jgi:hypothetical protein